MPVSNEVWRIQWQGSQHLLKPKPLMYICSRVGVKGRVGARGLVMSGQRGKMRDDNIGRRQRRTDKGGTEKDRRDRRVSRMSSSLPLD